MRKLIELVLVSIDGVIEEPEGWANFDDEDAAWSMEALGNYDAFVLGRVTYEKFLANWGHVTANPYIELINAMPKCVASRTLTDAAWNATLLGRDPSSAIAPRRAGGPGSGRWSPQSSRSGTTWSLLAMPHCALTR